MHMNSPDVRHEAFDFIDEIQNLHTTTEVMDAVHAALGRFGFQYFCFTFLPDPHETFEDVLLASRMPEEWLKLYEEMQFLHDRPSVRHCKRTLRPSWWFKEAPYDREQEPHAVEVIQRAYDCCLPDGLVIPIAALTNRVGRVWMGGQTLEVPERDMPALHLMAIYAFDRVRRLHARLQNESRSLSPREQDVLTWAARGKPAWEIGEILKISTRTVELHVHNICRKLGAANRTQAVMIALRDHLMQT